MPQMVRTSIDGTPVIEDNAIALRFWLYIGDESHGAHATVVIEYHITPAEITKSSPAEWCRDWRIHAQ
jgi:hypothetical protein